MAAVGGVALLAQIPDVGVGVLPVILELRIAREEAPFGVDGAAAENIRHEVSGIAFALKLVIRRVNILDALEPQQREIAEGLKLNGDYVDPLILRDIRIGIRGKRSLGLGLVIAVGREIHRRADAVNEGIDKALRAVHVVGRPAVCVLKVFRPDVVDVRACVNGFPQRPYAQDNGKRRDRPRSAADAPAHEEKQQQRADNDADKADDYSLCERDVVVRGYAQRRMYRRYVRKHEGIIAEHELKVVSHACRDKYEAAHEKRYPGPVYKAVN